MRNKYVQPTKKTALESEEVKLVAPESEDNRPLEAASAENAENGSGKGSEQDVKVTAPESEDNRPTEGEGDPEAAPMSNTSGEETVKVTQGESDDDRPLEAEQTDNTETDPDANTGNLDVTEVEFEIIENAVKEADVEIETKQEISNAVEVFEGYQDIIRHLLATESYSDATANVLQQAIAVQMRTVSSGIPHVSLEDFGGSLTAKARHEQMLGQLILEGAALNTIAQSYVVNWKRGFRAYADLFRSNAGLVNKYKAKLIAAQKEFDAKKAKFGSGVHQVSLIKLIDVYATAGGRVKDIMAALTADFAMSRYVLVDYPTKVLQVLAKINSIVSSGNMSTPEAAAKVIASIEAIPHPADLFDKKFIEGKSYLNQAHLDFDVSKTREPIEINGKRFDKLANLATKKKVVEAGAWGARFANGLGNKGTLVDEAQGKGVAGLTTDQIGKLIKFGMEYLHLVEQNLELVKKSQSLMESIGSNLNKLEDTMHGQTDKVIDRAFNQISDFASNTMFANFMNPARNEIKRAIKIASANQMMALRVIYNAERGTVQKSTPNPKA